METVDVVGLLSLACLSCLILFLPSRPHTRVPRLRERSAAETSSDIHQSRAQRLNRTQFQPSGCP